MKILSEVEAVMWCQHTRSSSWVDSCRQSMVSKGIEPIIWVNRWLEVLEEAEKIRRVRQIKDNLLKLSLQRVRILMLYIHLVRNLPLTWWTAKPCTKGSHLNSSIAGHKTWITSLMGLMRSLTAWSRTKTSSPLSPHQMPSPNSQDIHALKPPIEVL